MHVMLNRPESAERHGAGHVARCTVERLMADLGLRGVRRARSPRTTRSAPREQCPADLVKRHFSAFRPNELWVADITYVRTFSGWVYVAFVTDVFSRRIVGWQTSTSLDTDLALDALQMAASQRKRAAADLTGLVHHLRPWGAVPVHPLRGSPGRLRGSRLCRLQGRLLSALPWPRRSTRCTRPNSSFGQGPWQDIDAASGRHRRVGPLVRAPPGHTPPSGCETPPSTKPPGSPTSARTARNNHKQPPPHPDKPTSTKPGARQTVISVRTVTRWLDRAGLNQRCDTRPHRSDQPGQHTHRGPFPGSHDSPGRQEGRAHPTRGRLAGPRARYSRGEGL